jgi:transposase-like protein
VVTLKFKAEVVHHRKTENLSLAECGRKFDVLPKLVQWWKKQYEAGQLTAAAGRCAVSREQTETIRLRAELSRAKMSQETKSVSSGTLGPLAGLRCSTVPA